MSDVVPTGMGRDSEYLFERMTRRTLDLVRPECGTRLLDVASGFGQDAMALSRRGSWSVGAEPSRRMSGLARLQSERGPGPAPRRGFFIWRMAACGRKRTFKMAALNLIE